MRNKKIRVAIFTATNLKTSTGSTDTVLNLLTHLDDSKYTVGIILIDNLVPFSLRISRQHTKENVAYKPFSLVTRRRNVSRILTLSELSLSHMKRLFDIAIVAIYNAFGEDGRLLGLLDTIGIPYVSPSLKTSAVCFDKALTKSVLKGSGIAVPNGFEIYRNHFNTAEAKAKIEREFGYPIIVKSAECGASRGVTLLKNHRALHSAIERAFSFSDGVLIEEFIAGQEFSVGVLGHFTKPEVLPVVMIKTKRAFFDYRAKYASGESKEICPAPIPQKLTKELQRLASAAYRAVKAESHSRIDIIASDTRRVVLEINTFPGLTSGSIFPKELGAVGVSLGGFLDRMIAQKLDEKSASENF